MKKRLIITTLAAALMVVGCNGGNSNQVGSSQTMTTNATVAAPGLVTPDGSWVGAYFTNWSQWRSSLVAGEASGSAKHLDIFDQKAPSYISYAFFAPKVSTDIATTVGYGGGAISSGWVAQPNGTVGDLDNAYEADKAAANYAELTKFKTNNPATLVIASIGGWSYTARWSQFAKNAGYNVNSVASKAFLDSCEKLLRGNLTLPGGAAYPQFDGISIDWEYPGYGHKGSVQTGFAKEPAYFVALAKALRVRVDKVKAETGKVKVLTVALPIAPAKMTGNNSIKWSELTNTFDWIDLMAFDAHGQFDAADANLQTSKDQAPVGEITAAVNYLLDSGVDSRRIVLGAPTYTRQMLVKNKPTNVNNYGYEESGNMLPSAIGLGVYRPMLFTDAPNPENYYPTGGMVDNTGVYSYNCMLQKQGQLSANYCPAPATLPSATDNRGLFGQPLPTKMFFTEISGSPADLGVGHAWAYDDAFNVVKSPAAGDKTIVTPSAKYRGYSVFSYDTPSTIDQKITKLVTPYKLGGMWFWDIHNDAYKAADASKSLYMAAITKLGTNTGGIVPTPTPSVIPTMPPSSLAKPDGTWTGAYFTNWNQWRNSEVSGDSIGNTKHIDVFDHKAPSFISYAFFAPKVSTDSASTIGYGGGSIGSGWSAQGNGTVGDLDNAYEADKAKANYAELTKFKSNNSGTLIIASIGGWSYTARWSQFAKDANYDANSPAAKAFIDSCDKLLRGTLNLSGGSKYPKFDGINIDWEYPGYGHLGSIQPAFAKEPAFFEALSKQLRIKIDQLKSETGQVKVLTVALPVIPAKMTGNNSINWSNLAKTFDWIDLMAFDVHGQFDAADANLMSSKDQAPASEVLSAVRYLLDSGVDSRSIVLGAPTYTRQMLVKNKPNSLNNFAYEEKGNMDPIAIGLDVYKPMLFTDAPNAEDYYPSGGMVDNTGVYSYNCMLQKQGQLSANYCPAPKFLPNATDNRGLFGQPLPTTLYFTEIAGSSADLGVGHAWAYDDAYNVVKSPVAGNLASVANVKYNGYSVFSYDTPSIINQKIEKLVLPYKLGGVWFWDIHNDSYKKADIGKSLYVAATSKLGTNTQGVYTPPVCGGVEEYDNATVYQAGSQARINGVIYQANWYSLGSDPVANSGAYSQWKIFGPCPATPTPSPVPTVVPSPTPSPVPTVVPSPIPSPTTAPVCSGVSTWSSSSAYVAGNTVSYQGVIYKANWWTQNNNPASSNGGAGSGQPWTKVSNC